MRKYFMHLNEIRPGNLPCRLVLILVTILLSCASFAQDQMVINENRISDRVSVYNIEGLQSSNIITIATGEGLIIIDTETSPPFARAIREKIEETYPGKEVRYIINTHDHGDHTYGNQVFPEATVIGHERCREEMIRNKMKPGQTSTQVSAVLASLNKRLENLDKSSDAANKLKRMIAYYEPIAEGLGEGFILTPPSVTFSDRLSLSLGGVTLTMVYYGFSHSPGDIIVICPEEKLLVTGDLFYEGSEPYFDSERIPFIDRSLETLAEVMTDSTYIRYIVPGHGPIIPISLLAENMALINEKKVMFAGKESAFMLFKEEYENRGLEASLTRMKDLKAKDEDYFFLHPEFDTYAFRLMINDNLVDAREIFTLLADLFPDSYIAFDSLGEVCLRLEDNENAKKNFTRSLELNRENDNARNKLEGLK